ncbi:MAG: hypothetical protein Q8Q09_11895 [Deltaproteobacteria bacterium]|nr:hypothetical protein [Deltaproteobacteria bacterium]
MKLRLLASPAILLTVAHCSTAPSLPQSFSFNRPTAVDFVCLRVPVGSDGRIAPTTITNGTEVESFPIEQCPAVNAGTSSDLQMTATGFVGLRIFALVTQADRGEVALVNLHPRFNTGSLDTDPRVPGFTFIPAGAFASAIVTHPQGRVTYVGSAGDRAITILDNRRLLAGRNFELRNAGGEVMRFGDLPSEPIDLALRTVGNPARTLLYVLLRNGAVRAYDATNPTEIPVFRSEVMLTSPATPAGDGGTSLDATVGDADLDAAMDGQADASAEDGATRGPATGEHMVVGDDGRVFISDRSNPIVHVLAPDADGTTLRETTPLQVGVGTTRLAISPRLPSDQSHFVYAVTVGSAQLVVLDATLRDGVESATYGQAVRANAILDDPRCQTTPFDSARCPKIDPNLPHDRVPLRAPVRAVGFVGTRGRDESGLGQCDLTEPFVENCSSLPQPRLDVFRGIHAVVALANAQVQIVDLEDPDRNCDVRVGLGARRAFLRHLPRGGDATTRPTLIGAPQFTINGGASSPGGVNPAITALDGSDTPCNENNNHCIALPTQPGDSTLVDPLAVRDAQFVLRYEGQLPLRAIQAATFTNGATPGTVQLQAPGARLCELGALSNDRLVLSGPSPYSDELLRGDASVPLPAQDPMCPPDRCRAVFGDTSARCNREYRISVARPDGLELEVPQSMTALGPRAGEPCGVVDAASPAESQAEFARLLRCCYPQATRVEVRAAQSWVVATQPTGRSTEFQHNVIARDGACVEDPSLPFTGRLRENATYDSGALQLRISSGTQPTTRDSQFVFRTGGGYAQLVSNAGAPGATQVRFLCPSDRVFIVDQTPATLREYTLAPFTGTRTFN